MVGEIGGELSTGNKNDLITSINKGVRAVSLFSGSSVHFASVVGQNIQCLLTRLDWYIV